MSGTIQRRELGLFGDEAPRVLIGHVVQLFHRLRESTSRFSVETRAGTTSFSTSETVVTDTPRDSSHILQRRTIRHPNPT